MRATPVARLTTILLVSTVGCSKDQVGPTAESETQVNLKVKEGELKIDQSNTVTDNLGLGNGLYFQTFMPRKKILAQVDLLLIVNVVTSPVTTTVGIYADVQQSPLATTTAVVEPAAPGELNRTLSYTFDPIVELVPGQTYAIGWTGTGGPSWHFAFGDNYRDGQVLLTDGTPLNPVGDFVFTTYTPK